ncbi:MAG: sulfotransferase [Saprospiraceae bacterium]|nr:sulfotransferase [Saprospiraceae bacterium]
MNRFSIIFITGMHRSGTSVLSQAMNTFQYAHGDNPMPANQHNADGYWEDKDFVAFNDRLLAHLGGRWDSISNSLDGTSLPDYLTSFTEEAERLLLEKLAVHPRLVLKDPRLCLVLDFWQRIVDRLHIPHHHLYLIRPPEAVIQSLCTRNEFPRGKAELLYLQYNLLAIHQLQNKKCMYLHFPDLIENPIRYLEQIGTFLGEENYIPEIRGQSANLVKPELIHSDYQEAYPLEGLPLIHTLYSWIALQLPCSTPLCCADDAFQAIKSSYASMKFQWNYIADLETKVAFWSNLAIERLQIIETTQKDTAS